jgi:hypothetical protein
MIRKHARPQPPAASCRLPVPARRGALPNFLGCSLGPFPFAIRKCHQMSSKEHMKLGWVVRWVLSTPPGHPTAGRCGRVVPVLPLLLCTRPARAQPSVGGPPPPPPSRSALAPMESSPGPVLSPVTVLQFSQFVLVAHLKPWLQTRDRDYSTDASWPCAGWPKLLPSPTKSRDVIE